MTDLANAIARVERDLEASKAELGPYSWEDKSWQERRRAITARVAEGLTADLGARVTDDFHGGRVRILGIASSSTSGVEGALHNWLTAARRRIEA